jgi:hypothetical protein
MNDRRSDFRSEISKISESGFDISDFKFEISDLRSEYRIRLIDLLSVCMAQNHFGENLTSST